MIHYTKNPLINDAIPDAIDALIKQGIETYIVLKDGHIIASDITSNDEYYIENFDEALSDENTLLKTIDSLNTNTSDAYQYVMEEANSGLLIKVKKNQHIDQHLHVFILQEEHDLVHNSVIALDANASLKMTEYFMNVNPSSVNVVNHYYLEENARLDYTSVNVFDEKSVINIIREGFVKRYANLALNHAEVSDALSDVLCDIKLIEPYAKATVKTVALTNQTQNAKFEQTLEHLAKDTEGFIENYGVSSDESCLVFEGVGKINKGMKHSVARQSNKGIILSKKARLDANPLLLIDEFDVVASHGAAIGQIDEAQLYYLMSRGLSKLEAERLIINGFLSPILSALDSEAIKNTFMESVHKKTHAF
jgi:Fe-S cluster assembly protein SufD